VLAQHSAGKKVKGMPRPRKKPPADQRSAFRATAERIAEWLQTKEQLIDMIETALLAERDRCAKIAETSYEQFQTGYNAGKYIAAAIRQGSTDAEK